MQTSCMFVACRRPEAQGQHSPYPSAVKAADWIACHADAAATKHCTWYQAHHCGRAEVKGEGLGAVRAASMPGRSLQELCDADPAKSMAAGCLHGILQGIVAYPTHALPACIHVRRSQQACCQATEILIHPAHAFLVCIHVRRGKVSLMSNPKNRGTPHARLPFLHPC